MGRPAITVKPRYDFAPLEALLRVQLRPELNGAGQERGFPGRMAEALGVDRRQVIRWREYGVPADMADDLVGRVGAVPWELWPQEWYEGATRTCEAPACAVRFVAWPRPQRRFCSSRCRNRSRTRPWDSTPAARERTKRWQDANRPYLALYKRNHRSKKKTATSTKNEDNARSYLVQKGDVIRHGDYLDDTSTGYKNAEIPAQCHALSTGYPRNAVSDAAQDAVNEQEVA